METDFAFLVGINTALCEALKHTIGISRKLNRFMPLLSIITGVILSVLSFEKKGLVIGIAVGLASSGLYSGGKNLIRKS